MLVVEDDEADAYLIGHVLMREPSIGQVVRAVDGVEALEMVERGKVSPDLAFIDLHMPRRNGLDLLLEFAARPEFRFPMVVLTSSSATVDVIRSRLSGALRVISKPDTVEAMQGAVAEAIQAACPALLAQAIQKPGLDPPGDDVPEGPRKPARQGQRIAGPSQRRFG
ncbi:MAG: response regulator [Caulobacteraceae bacterium]|nr:response regulator [Caulobacteraceae bacterium]